MSLLRRYLAIVAPARWPVLGYLLAGSAVSLKPLAAVFLLRDFGHGYDVVGLVVAAELTGSALAMPVIGRLVDRLGPRRVMIALVLLHAELLVAFVYGVRGGWPAWALVVTTFGWGATQPSILPALRAFWGTIYSGDDRDTAYALQAVLSEVVFLLGPLLASGIAVLSSPTAALLAAAVLTVTGIVVFAMTVRLPRRARDPSRRGLAITNRTLGVVAVVSGLGGLAGGSLEILLPVLAEHGGNTERAGLGFAVLAVGSMVGGLVYGSRSWGSPLARRYAGFQLLLAVALIPLVLVPSFGVVLVLLLLGGMAIAPGEACLYGLVDDLADPALVVEANAWVAALFTLGVGLGASAAGVLAHGTDVAVAAALPAVAAAVGAALLTGGVRVPFTGPAEPARPVQIT